MKKIIGDYSFVGVYKNTVAANYSAILGGSGNNDGGNPYVGIYGQNITNTCSGYFHVNSLIAQNIQPTSGGTAPPLGALPGTLYYVVVGGNKQVWVA